MKITLRRYKLNEIGAILELVENFLYEQRNGTVNHFYSLVFDGEKVKRLLTRRHSDVDFFCNVVVDEDGKILGLLSGEVAELISSRQKTAADWLLYMRPDFINVRVVLRLITTFVTWARERGAMEVHLCNSSGYKQEKFATLMKLAGFEQFMVGFSKRIT